MLTELYEDGMIDIFRKYFLGFEECSVQTARFLHLIENLYRILSLKKVTFSQLPKTPC